MATDAKKKSSNAALAKAIKDHVAQHHSSSQHEPYHTPSIFSLNPAQSFEGLGHLLNAIVTAPSKSSAGKAALSVGSLGDKNAGKPIVNIPGLEPAPPPAAKKSSTTTPAASGGQVNAPGALQIGFQQYIMPYLNQLQQMMAGTTQQQNSYMNGLLSGPNAVQLSPAIRQALQATQPGMTAATSLQNQASLMSPLAGQSLDQLATIIQNTQAAQQQAQGEYEKQYGVGLAGAEGIPGISALPGVATTPTVQPSSVAQPPTATGSLASQLNPTQAALQNQIIAQGMGVNSPTTNPLLTQQQQYAGG